jgi:ATP-binding cassette subfamily B protein
MNYALNDPDGNRAAKARPMEALRAFLPLLRRERLHIAVAVVAMLLNSLISLVGPVLVGYSIDTFFSTGRYSGVLLFSGILLTLYVISFFAGYVQTRMMGGVAQRLLFNLRNTIFMKLQELPVAFFNQNKTGDLISRINNDTDKLNQFFSQSLMQFIGSLFMMAGAGVFLLSINFRLGAASLAPALGLLLFTRAASAWIRRKNAQSLQVVGDLSAEIQESLNNFKVIVAFNRRDYFREKFDEANERNFRASVSAGVANTIFVPVYGLSSNAAQLIVLTYGVALISGGHFTIGLLISYLAYVTRFYDPLRQIAALWASFQGALAAWDRIASILRLDSDIGVLPAASANGSGPVLEFRDVHFRYPGGKEVLHGIDLALEKGKTYALVGPTGGGKTTTATLMARLYDPTEGAVLLHGRDIRSYDSRERTRSIGFILQEPFLFTGTIRDNIVYGNEDLQDLTNEELKADLERKNLGDLIGRFENGLDTKLVSGGDAVSLGQRQIIAFMRAVLRNPEVLILDEATANVDTVTEQLLEDILEKLPEDTTRVIIAHRLNTIENADEIFFVNSGEVARAGSFDHAVEMLMQGKRES